jgi:2-dehydro-3-deoxygluconokinase
VKKIFCFGELLIRFSPALNRQWIKENKMPVYIGGAELNVATALAKWNMPVKYCTALPGNYLGKEIIEELQSKKIDTSAIHISGNRIGTFYLPHGADLKSAGVIYDRAGSSFAELRTGMIDWDTLLNDCGWFHFSAICPALNEHMVEVCKEGLQAASKRGMTISVDLNYRPKLWQYGKKPADIMPALVNYCNVVMGNLWAAESLLGISSELAESTGKTKGEMIEAAGVSMLKMHRQFPNVTTIANTFRLEKEYWGIIQHGKEMCVSKEFALNNIADKAGSGDCFMGGLIFGLINQHPLQEIVNYAASAAVGKLQEAGDTTNQTVEQIKSRY